MSGAASAGDPAISEPPSSPGQQWSDLLGRHRLTPVQRRVARYISEQPAQVAALGAGELAERTGVSQPSVSRFAKALGFAGYPELRRWLRRFVASDQPERSGDRSRLRLAIDSEIANLRRLDGWLEQHDHEVSRAGRLLAGADTVFVTGLRASASVAAHFAFFAAKLHPDVRRLSEGESAAWDAMSQCPAPQRAVLLAIALPRCPRQIVVTADAARALGLRTVVMTDDVVRAVTTGADVVLPVGVSARLVFDTPAAPMLSATALLEAMADAAPVRTQRRLEAFERIAEAHGYFDPE